METSSLEETNPSSAKEQQLLDAQLFNQLLNSVKAKYNAEIRRKDEAYRELNRKYISNKQYMTNDYEKTKMKLQKEKDFVIRVARKRKREYDGKLSICEEQREQMEVRTEVLEDQLAGCQNERNSSSSSSSLQPLKQTAVDHVSTTTSSSTDTQVSQLSQENKNLKSLLTTCRSNYEQKLTDVSDCQTGKTNLQAKIIQQKSQISELQKLVNENSISARQENLRLEEYLNQIDDLQLKLGNFQISLNNSETEAGNLRRENLVMAEDYEKLKLLAEKGESARNCGNAGSLLRSGDIYLTCFVFASMVLLLSVIALLFLYCRARCRERSYVARSMRKTSETQRLNQGSSNQTNNSDYSL